MGRILGNGFMNSSQFRKRFDSEGDILVALGSNAAQDIDRSVEFITKAIFEIRNRFDAELTVSRLYRSQAYPQGSGPDYVNAAIAMTSNQAPGDLLRSFHDIEQIAGRKRAVRWGQRTLDVDLIAVGNRILPDPLTVRRWIDLPLAEQLAKAPTELVLPHPRIQDRAFVLLPLADIAPDWRHPILRRSVREMVAALPAGSVNTVIPLAISESRP